MVHYKLWIACTSGIEMKTCTRWQSLLFALPLMVVLPLIFSVLELHHDSAIGESPKKTRKKFDHLVFGPAAGQGLHNRLQCQGTKSLNKTQHSTRSFDSNTGESTVFVTVFTIYNTSMNGKLDRAPSDLVTVGNRSYTKLERSMAILDIFIRFVQVIMPQSNIVILTDPASDLHIDRERVLMYPIQGDYSREKLMLQRIRSYIAFLDSRLAEISMKQGQGQVKHYIFTDSDIAVVDDLSQIFREHPDFDVALTFRNNKEQPLNSGFIAVRGTSDAIQRAKVFLLEVWEAYSTRYMKASRMLGDQLALIWAVRSDPSFDSRRFSKLIAFVQKIKGVTILFLPCSIYNWTPPEGAGQFHGMPLDVKVVHFKGSRKRLMVEAWNFFKSSRSLEDMLCLVLASGRAKYDF